MAKGRKPSTLRNDHLLLGTAFGYVDHGAGRSVGPEFDHDDVWPTAEPVRPARSDGQDDVRRQLGGLSLSFGNGGGGDRRKQRRHECASSAPVDVPSRARPGRAGSADPAEGSEGADDAEWVPPHEYLAREHGRGVTTSVFEGAGRTLKGRDMSRVRDAVWRQTGFFG